MTVIFVVLTFTVFIIAGLVIQKIRERKSVPEAARPGVQFTVSPNEFEDPAGVFTFKGQTWASLEPSGDVKVGLGNFVIKLFSKFDEISLPKIGDKIDQGDKVVSLMKSGRKAKVGAPISGEVIAINEEVLKNPEKLAQDNTGQNWVFAIKPRNLQTEIRRLRLAEEATAWLKAEVLRLKDFLMRAYSSNSATLQPTMADGGLLVDGAIEHLDDDSWDELKEKFLS